MESKLIEQYKDTYREIIKGDFILSFLHLEKAMLYKKLFDIEKKISNDKNYTLLKIVEIKESLHKERELESLRLRKNREKYKEKSLFTNDKED